MAVYGTPEQHAANTPDTWTVVKVGAGAWRLTDREGSTLDRFTTKRDAEEARESGTLRRLYDEEGRWYAGQTPHGRRSWADCKAERDAMDARRAASNAVNHASRSRDFAIFTGQPTA